MISNLLLGDYSGVELFHIRLSFSRTMPEIGRIQLRKAFHLISIVFQIIYTRLRTGATVLYYPPAGPDRIPVYRDIAILLLTRWIFEHTILHFHAGGVSQLYPSLPQWLKVLFCHAYGKADVGIRTSALAPDDPRDLASLEQLVIPYGIADHAATYVSSQNSTSHTPTILYVGVLRESKGLLVLLNACASLRRRGRDFRVELVGAFASAEFELRMRQAIHESQLDSVIEFKGVLSKESKYEAYACADVFCFPTFFESETFGVVLLEAMQFELPIVAARWRGIPAVVTHGENGYLVPPGDPDALAEQLDRLLCDPLLAADLGRCGRRKYETDFTLQCYHKRLQDMFDLLSRKILT